LTGEDRQQGVECARRANILCNHGRTFVLAMLAETQFQAAMPVPRGGRQRGSRSGWPAVMLSG
jgi:hypothetical protein